MLNGNEKTIPVSEQPKTETPPPQPQTIGDVLILMGKNLNEETSEEGKALNSDGPPPAVIAIVQTKSGQIKQIAVVPGGSLIPEGGVSLCLRSAMSFQSHIEKRIQDEFDAKQKEKESKASPLIKQLSRDAGLIVPGR